MFKIYKNISLKENFTFKIGGKAKYFIKVSNLKDIKKAIFWAEERKVSFFILGGGSNILFPDDGYNGLIIKIENKKIILKNNEIIVEAGVPLLRLVFFSKEKSLSGLEWAAGIPGTVGGAVFGNAGAFGGEIKDSIKEVLVFDIKTKKEKLLQNKDCKFSYRNSIFKKTKRYIIISATFKLKKGKKEKISEEINKNILYRKNNHPLNYPSAGSIFKNCKIDNKVKKLFKKFPDLKQFEKKGEIPAAYLIYKCDLKGKKIRGAQVSEKHTNFIINKKNAKARDVIELIKLIKNKVKKKFNIELKEEIILKI